MCIGELREVLATRESDSNLLLEAKLQLEQHRVEIEFLRAQCEELRSRTLELEVALAEREPLHGALQQQQACIREGDKLEVVVGFMSNSDPPVLLQPGLRGDVLDLDEDGDILVSFGSSVGHQWLYHEWFDKPPVTKVPDETCWEDFFARDDEDIVASLNRKHGSSIRPACVPPLQVHLTSAEAAPDFRPSGRTPRTELFDLTICDADEDGGRVPRVSQFANFPMDEQSKEAEAKVQSSAALFSRDESPRTSVRHPHWRDMSMRVC